MESLSNVHCAGCCVDGIYDCDDYGPRNAPANSTGNRYLRSFHTSLDGKGSLSGMGRYSPTDLDCFHAASLFTSNSISNSIGDIHQPVQYGSALVKDDGRQHWRSEFILSHQQKQPEPQASFFRFQSTFCPHCANEVLWRSQSSLARELPEKVDLREYPLHGDLPLDNDSSPMSPRMLPLFQLGTYSEGNRPLTPAAGQNAHPGYSCKAGSPAESPTAYLGRQLPCAISPADDLAFEDALLAQQSPCLALQQLHLDSLACAQPEDPSSFRELPSFNTYESTFSKRNSLLQFSGETTLQSLQSSSFQSLLEAAASPAKTKRSIRAGQRVQFYKTRLCPHLFSKTHYCRRKAACSYAHSIAELRPSIDLTRTKLCQDYLCGSCQKRHCTFAHGIQELRGLPSGES